MLQPVEGPLPCQISAAFSPKRPRLNEVPVQSVRGFAPSMLGVKDLPGPLVTLPVDQTRDVRRFILHDASLKKARR